MPQRLSEIYIYPVKSSARLQVEEAEVHASGLQYDRRWAVVDESNHILTAREFPALLTVRSKITPISLGLAISDAPFFDLPFISKSPLLLECSLFGNIVHGRLVDSRADQLLSELLNTSCRLIFMDDYERTMNPKHGGNDTDPVSYADTAPILLVAKETLDELNSRLPYPVSVHNFRPNLVIEGCIAGEEETWKQIRIGDTEFQVCEPCKRCVLTTLDPDTLQTRTDQEPLRTLAGYQRHPRGGVSFGITLVPRGGGRIRAGNALTVL